MIKLIFGVLIDDLITHGTQEPYRMFTSRAEYRLSLREDNADLRLTEIGHDLNLISATRWQTFGEKRDAITAETTRLKSCWVSPATEKVQEVNKILAKPLTKDQNAFDLLRRPEIDYATLTQVFSPSLKDTAAAEQVEIQAKYSGYIERQQQDIAKQRRYENTPIPAGFVYDNISGLSAEVQQKLSVTKPTTVGIAARIPGITPAAISLLLIHLKKAQTAIVKEA